MKNSNIKLLTKDKVEGLFSKVANKLDKSCLSNFQTFIEHLFLMLQDKELEDQELRYWQTLVFDIQEILKACVIGDTEAITQLNEMFYKELEFGTGGMRGITGAGTNRVNLFTIGKATQGFAAWLKKENSGLKEISVVIAFDSRILSRELSLKSSLVLAAQGIKVFLFKDVAPTPLLSFAVRYLKASGGIVVTASHNPPQYNGYKVYRDDGCQVPPPKDNEIIQLVKKEKGYSSISKELAIEKGLLEILNREVDEQYIKELRIRRLWDENTGISIGYSPLHGTGERLLSRTIREMGFNEVSLVAEQATPDGNFPTVEYPNPEDSKALELLIEHGKRNNLDIIMANDPDADRVGIGVRKGSEYVLLNGNQTGSIMAYYILQRLKERNAIPPGATMIKTIVTTELQKKIASDFGVRLIDTLTGFKYIGEWMSKLQNDGSGKYIFGGEESYGYLPVDFLRDKDGISSCYFIVEAANYYASKGKTLLDQLEEIYQKYGYFLESLYSEKFPGKSGMEKMNNIMDFARKHTPSQLDKLKIVSVFDIKDRTRLNILTGEKVKDESLPPSNVIQYDLEGGGKMTLRPSGTEPKIKFYFSISKDLLPDQKSEDLKPQMEKMIDDMMNDFRGKIIEPNL